MNKKKEPTSLTRTFVTEIEWLNVNVPGKTAAEKQKMINEFYRKNHPSRETRIAQKIKEMFDIMTEHCDTIEDETQIRSIRSWEHNFVGMISRRLRNELSDVEIMEIINKSFEIKKNKK